MKITKLTPKGMEAVASALVAIGFEHDDRDLHRGDCRIAYNGYAQEVKALYSLLRVPAMDIPKFLTKDLENWCTLGYPWKDKFVQVILDIACYRMDAEAE